MLDTEGDLFQAVRLVDVFVLGPLIISAAQTAKLSPVARTFLTVAGVATIVFNGVTFLDINKRRV